MSYHSRRILTPGASRKRKEMEALVSSTSPKPLIPPTTVTHAVSFTTQQPLSSNRLLAGYMAYEFLTQGTLLGQKLDTAQAESAPASNAAESKKSKSSQAEPIGTPMPKPQSYTEVANLLKSNRVHIPGLVNPTQLARWIQM